jgi:16S rRNA (uracil1498-N3)-methyltransferase
MARQFIFKNENITKVDKAYLNDVLCLHSAEVSENSNLNQLYKLTGEELKHIQVLRHKMGDNIIINNMECNIVYISRDFAIVNKLNDINEKGKPSVNITLYPAFLKNDKMDYLIQKSVELGVTNIVPFFSKNTIVKLEDKDKVKRKDKLQKICIEATKQCGRTDEVTVNEFIHFSDMLKIIAKHDFCIFAYENETTNIKSVINNLKNENKIYKDIAIIVGPEGGFDSKEAEELKKITNVYTVSLGERILRAETASINLITILMYEFDKK